ncbi:hypothetical protein OG930_37445 [Streptomyces sp. NBC_01799]|uniref:hypothetical protein n=1 Tax=Streptomyces sp. NBC_01800 TaxID=2975945 RepID=UPI002DDBB337|nr:hypothetical protein [Streptomyces sp. NBC_01800]WSA74159.1 hypothetical protein OIE65_38090 [Streptomyces sp. NBC_01800]WSA80808.1 hypothetical protein OG930_37445 [Streptomyces sp. NBC_01799]
MSPDDQPSLIESARAHRGREAAATEAVALRRVPFGGRVPSALPSRLEPRLLWRTLPRAHDGLIPGDDLLDQRPN